jgi:hypothetical protein
MFLTGCKTISVKTLEKLKSFFESGGTIISTTQLPYKSSEMGKDGQVLNLLNEIFGLNPLNSDSVKIQTHSNTNGGVAVYIPKPDKNSIQKVLDERMDADVRFSPNPVLSSDFGKFNYIHKIKDGRNIYFFANSSDEEIETEVLIRGKLNLESWNPHNGSTSKMEDPEPVQKEGQVYSKFKLKLNPVSSVFWVRKN